MERADIWFDCRIGMVQPIGDLDAGSAERLFKVVFEAGVRSSINSVLIIEDSITSVSEEARKVLTDAQALWNDLGGCIAVVSVDGRCGTGGRISSHGIIECSYSHMKTAIRLIHDHAQVAAERRRRP